jgi:DNA (cytosine-5)-methyltransferase 1
MRHGSLFSGIGGFDLASEWMGWENVFHCEWNEFGQKVLNYYWPKAISYHDITKTDFSIHRGTIDIITGGFPCQPYSMAGKRKGKEDDRHLWPEMCRAIREIQPSYVVGENVRGLTNWNGGLVFDEVQADLEAEGYEVTPFLLPACAVNAPHKRDRIWFVAYSMCKGYTRPTSTRIEEDKGRELYNENRKHTWKNKKNNWCNWPNQPYVLLRDNGFPGRLDNQTFSSIRRESIKAGGNAIVPQVVHQIFKAIEQYNELDKQLSI